MLIKVNTKDLGFLLPTMYPRINVGVYNHHSFHYLQIARQRGGLGLLLGRILGVKKSSLASHYWIIIFVRRHFLWIFVLKFVDPLNFLWTRHYEPKWTKPQIALCSEIWIVKPTSSSWTRPNIAPNLEVKVLPAVPNEISLDLDFRANTEGYRPR